MSLKYIFGKFLVTAAMISSLSARAECLGETMDRNLAVKNSLLSIALADLNGFSYVRNPLDAWQAKGYSICATGIALEKNIYQYFRFFIQIEVRAPSGELKALVPALFQTASVQAHDSTGPKPWTVMPNSNVLSILATLVEKFSPQYSMATFPAPSDEKFLAAVKAMDFAKGLDAASFFVMPIPAAATKNETFYLASWMELVSGTGGGGLYTQQYSPKMLLLKYASNGSVQIDTGVSGFRDLLSPLDSLLSSIHAPYEPSAQEQLLLKYSNL